MSAILGKLMLTARRPRETGTTNRERKPGRNRAARATERTRPLGRADTRQTLTEPSPPRAALAIERTDPGKHCQATVAVATRACSGRRRARTPHRATATAIRKTAVT